MKLARLFSYTQELEAELSRQEKFFEELSDRFDELEARRVSDGTTIAVLRGKLEAAETNIEILRDQKDEYRFEARNLREQNAALLDRVALKLDVIPPSEPTKREPLSEEQQNERRETVDSIRRSGPVAKARQQAEAAYQAELDHVEALRRKDAKAQTVSS